MSTDPKHTLFFHSELALMWPTHVETTGYVSVIMKIMKVSVLIRQSLQENNVNIVVGRLQFVHSARRRELQVLLLLGTSEEIRE